MVDEAARNEAADARRKDEVDKRNALEALVHQTGSMLADGGDAMPEQLRADVETARGEATSAIEAQDPARIEAASERLTTASHALAQAMYSGGSAGPTGPAGPTEAPEPEDDGVIDADFEEKRAS
ncbi:MAG: Hsp70 family protein [Myxococcota bacterium]